MVDCEPLFKGWLDKTFDAAWKTGIFWTTPAYTTKKHLAADKKKLQIDSFTR